MSLLLDTGKFNFASQQSLQFQIWFIMTLYYKMGQILSNATAILLQNVTKLVTKCVRFFITKCYSYYKLWRLLQNVSVHPPPYFSRSGWSITVHERFCYLEFFHMGNKTGVNQIDATSCLKSFLYISPSTIRTYLQMSQNIIQ